MKTRKWISSGITEELDKRQQQLLENVYGQIDHYYRNLYLTTSKFAVPLTLSTLSKLCKRSNVVVMGAVRMLANTIEEGEEQPRIYYQRIKSGRNASHRPYQIFLR